MEIPENNLGEFFDEFAKAILIASQQEKESTAKAALVEARKLSSGTMSLAEQRKLDNPFARRHGSPLAPVGIVNKHSGAFFEGWKLREGTQSDGYSTDPTIYNDSTVAPFLEQPEGGPKSKMFARPLEEEIAEAVLPNREKLFEAALQKNLPK